MPPELDPPSHDCGAFLRQPDAAPPGLLFVLSGPSGAGKDTVISDLKRQGLPVHFAVTLTTRPIRPAEVDGVDYFFVSVAGFHRLQQQGALLESALVHGHHYGTPREQVLAALRSGQHVLLKIDVQGAAQVKQLLPDAVFIFLAPSSVGELVSRLVNRATESPEEQARRLRDAHCEMQNLSAYDYVVLNREGRVAEAVEYIKSIIIAEQSRVHPRRIEL